MLKKKVGSEFLSAVVKLSIANSSFKMMVPVLVEGYSFLFVVEYQQFLVSVYEVAVNLCSISLRISSLGCDYSGCGAILVSCHAVPIYRMRWNRKHTGLFHQRDDYWKKTSVWSDRKTVVSKRLPIPHCLGWSSKRLFQDRATKN